MLSKLQSSFISASHGPEVDEVGYGGLFVIGGIGNGFFELCDAFVFTGVDGDDGYAHLPLQAVYINGDAFLPRNIHHCECNDDWNFKVHDLAAEEEIAFQIGGIGNNDNQLGPVGAFAVEQYFVGNLFIGAFGIEAVCAGQIDNAGGEGFGYA